MSARLHRIVRSGVGTSPILVMLHGVGSNEEDLMGLAPQLDPRLTIVAFRGPRLYGPGYSWFDIEWTPTGLIFDEAQAEESLAMIQSELRSLPEELGLPGSPIILGGFSQGAAMTCGVIFAEPTLLSGAILLSGRKARIQPREDLAGLPCLVQHGVYDPVIEVHHGREIRDELARLGAEVEYHEYPMGHEVSYESLGDMREWLSAR